MRKKSEPVLHLAFWLLLFALSVSITSRIFPLLKAIMGSGFAMLLLSGVAYLNALAVVPRFFKKGKYGWFVLSVAGLGFTCVAANVLIISILHGSEMGSVGMRRGVGAPVFFNTVLILFISTAYSLAKQFLKIERRTARLEQEKTAHELRFLRSQINPHFLFNALNNLHATVQLRPQQAGDFILKLGEMLRYVLDDCARERVSLAQEISYLENFIFFQKQKDDALQNVSLKISGDDPATFFLEPMLLIPLVENAFQHSFAEDVENQFVAIDISLKNGELRFVVRNNLPANSVGENGSRGLGLQNVRRRLHLLYPGRHSLNALAENGEFRAELTLKPNANA